MMTYLYFQTILIYTLLTIVMVWLAKRSLKTNKNIYIYIALLIYAFVFGVRYGVGTDYLNYLDYFDCLYKGIDTYLLERWEIGFVSFTKLISILNLSPPYYFGIIAFLQIWLLIKAVSRQKYIYPCLLLVFMLGVYWLSFANGLRHILAVCLWMLSLKYAIERKPIIHYLFILLAISMHNSSWVLIIFYPIIKYCGEDWFKNTISCYAILGFSLICMNVGVIQNVVNNFNYLISVLGYETYIEEYVLEKEITLGIGFYVTLLLNVITLANGVRVKRYFNDRLLNIFFSLYIVGIFLKYTFISSQLLSRINYFFNYFSVFVYSFVLYFFLKKERPKSYYYITLLLLVFIGTIYKAEINTSLYIFYWQKAYYSLKHLIFEL